MSNHQNKNNKNKKYELSEKAQYAIRKNLVQDSVKVIEEQMEKWENQGQQKPLRKKWLYYTRARQRVYKKWYQGFVNHANEKGLVLSSHWVDASRNYANHLLNTDAVVVGTLSSLDPLCFYVRSIVNTLSKDAAREHDGKHFPSNITHIVSELSTFFAENATTAMDVYTQNIPVVDAEENIERTLAPFTVHVTECASNEKLEDEDGFVTVSKKSKSKNKKKSERVEFNFSNIIVYASFRLACYDIWSRYWTRYPKIWNDEMLNNLKMFSWIKDVMRFIGELHSEKEVNDLFSGIHVEEEEEGENEKINYDTTIIEGSSWADLADDESDYSD